MGTIFIWPLFILLLQRFRNPGKNIFKLFAAPFLQLKKPAMPALISHILYLISYSSSISASLALFLTDSIPFSLPASEPYNSLLPITSPSAVFSIK